MTDFSNASGGDLLSEDVLEVETAEQNMLNTLSQADQKVESAQSSYMGYLSAQQPQVDEANTEILNALNTLTQINQNPPIVNKIMNTFGIDRFNRNLQETRIQKGQFQLEQIKAKSDRAKMARDITITSAQQDIAQASETADLRQQQFKRTESILDIMNDAERLQMARETHNQSTVSFIQSQEDRAVSELTDEQLNAEINSPTLGIAPGLLQSEFKSRKSIDLDLRAAEVAANKGEMELATALVDNVLENMTTDQTLEAVQMAQEEGGIITLAGVEITSEKLARAADDKMQQDFESFDSPQAQATLDSAKARIDSASVRLALLQNESGGPSPEIQLALEAFESQAKALLEGGDLAALDELITNFDEGFIKQQFEAARENLEPGQKAAFTQHVSGAPVQVNAAQNYLGELVGNTNFGNNVIGDIGRELTSRQQALRVEAERVSDFSLGRDGKPSFTPRGSRALKPNVLNEQAIIGDGNLVSDLRIDAHNMIGQNYIGFIVDQLNQGENTGDRWDNIYNPKRRMFAEAYNSVSADGEGVGFSLNKFLTEMVIKSDELRQTGVLLPGDELLDVILDTAYTQENITAYLETQVSNNTTSEASLRAVLFQGGDPSGALVEYISNMANQSERARVEQTEVNALETRRAEARELDVSTLAADDKRLREDFAKSNQQLKVKIDEIGQGVADIFNKVLGKD